MQIKVPAMPIARMPVPDISQCGPGLAEPIFFNGRMFTGHWCNEGEHDQCTVAQHGCECKCHK